MNGDDVCTLWSSAKWLLKNLDDCLRLPGSFIFLQLKHRVAGIVTFLHASLLPINCKSVPKVSLESQSGIAFQYIRTVRILKGVEIWGPKYVTYVNLSLK